MEHRGSLGCPSRGEVCESRWKSTVELEVAAAERKQKQRLCSRTAEEESHDYVLQRKMSSEPEAPSL